MTAPVCFLDLDGTLADLVTALARAHGKSIQRGTWPATYDLRVALEKTHDQIWEHPEVRGEAFWLGLEKLPWADELVALARERFDEVAILSQGVQDPACYAGKVAWVQRHYPGLHVAVATRKVLHARPGLVLVDDYERNETEWTARGGEAILVPAPWNRLRGTPDGDVVRVVREAFDRHDAEREERARRAALGLLPRTAG